MNFLPQRLFRFFILLLLILSSLMFASTSIAKSKNISSIKLAETIKTIPAIVLDGSKWKFLVECDFGEISYSGPFKVIGKNQILWTRYFEHPNDDTRNQTFKSKGRYIEKDQKLIFKRGGNQPGEIILQFINKEDATYAKGFFTNHSKCNIEDTNVSQMAKKPKDFLKIAQSNQTKLLFAKIIKEKVTLKKLKVSLTKKESELSKKEKNLQKKSALLSAKEEKQIKNEAKFRKQMTTLRKNETKLRTQEKKQKLKLQLKTKELQNQKTNFLKTQKNIETKNKLEKKKILLALKTQKNIETKNKLEKKKILLALQTELKRKIKRMKKEKEQKINLDKREKNLKIQLSALKKKEQELKKQKQNFKKIKEKSLVEIAKKRKTIKEEMKKLNSKQKKSLAQNLTSKNEILNFHKKNQTLEKREIKLKKREANLQKSEQKNAEIEKRILMLEKRETAFRKKVKEHENRVKIQLNNIAKIRKKIHIRPKTKKKLKKIKTAEITNSPTKQSIMKKLNIPCRLNVGNNYSYISFDSFIPKNISSIFPKGKSGYGKSDTAKKITLEIKGNNYLKEFTGKVRYIVRGKQVTFPYDRDFPKINLSRSQINKIFGNSYKTNCSIAKGGIDSYQADKNKLGDVELAEIAQVKIKEKKFDEAETYINKIQDNAIRSLLLKSIKRRNNRSNSGINKKFAKDLRFFLKIGCELKKIEKKKGLSSEQKSKMFFAMLPKIKLMKEAKERMEKFKNSLSGNELKKYKEAGLKIISEINLECFK